jgi:hypothetical protein
MGIEDEKSQIGGRDIFGFLALPALIFGLYL